MTKQKNKMDKPLFSEKDLMKFRKFLNSKDGKKSIEKIIDKMNKSCRDMKIADEDGRIKYAEWWAKNKDIPFTI